MIIIIKRFSQKINNRNFDLVDVVVEDQSMEHTNFTRQSLIQNASTRLVVSSDVGVMEGCCCCEIPSSNSRRRDYGALSFFSTPYSIYGLEFENFFVDVIQFVSSSVGLFIFKDESREKEEEEEIQ